MTARTRPIIFSAPMVRALWDSINGDRPGCAWADNPWVAALTFDVIRENVDAVLARERCDQVEPA